ncbi:mRNA-decapping enzyme 1B isoform X1 [Anopheles stephensi]|uniref:mRNA-decapping enzyme 1B isoform X1 n=1 Tax=Anopheles stephensi TaxID=30069 RepID=UPI001658C348|nr:mRNA-decapping enzyme 1B isoform X1 [Anopheles stephensi]
MADQTELRMNLVAIKRVDPYAKDIVNSSAHVALYVFNNAENEWEKTDIEGALFIYSRFAEPYHSIFINNRLNTNSLVEPIRGQIELQSKPPFLLYRNERSRIRGFWFYNNSECDRIGEVIQKLVTDCGDGGGGGPPMNGGGGGGGEPAPSGIYPGAGMMNGSGGAPENESNNVDIFTMLTKAQEDFQNNATVPPSAPKTMEQLPVMNHHLVMMANHPGAGIAIPQQQHPHHQQQQQQQQQPITNQNAPRSVVNFFAAAKQPAASEVPLFKTLAPVHTLEQIEKQHRATTPQKEHPNTGKVTPDVSELENSFKRMGIPIVTGGGGSNGPQTPSAGMPELGTSPLATFISAANLSAAMRANHHQPVVPKTKLIEISELESRQSAQQQQQQQQTPLHELLKKSDPIGGNGTTGGATVVKPALMPPTMFKPTASPAATQEALSSLLLGASGTANLNSPAGGGATKQQQQQQGNGQGTPGGQSKAGSTQGSTTLVGSTGKQRSTGSSKQRDGASTVVTPPKAGAPGTATSNKMYDILSDAKTNSSNSNLINNNSSGTAATGGVEPLTQNQLIQAVSYLMKHDPDFVRKLHEAYVKSFTEMISN